MKEEGHKKKNLPPKMSGVCRSGASTPSKSANDEILSSLLRLNNFDSISSIKDESLDIDLSACVTISADSAMMINGNSLSTTDFWRVLDESAQNSQLDLTLSSDDSINMRHEPFSTELPQNLLSTPDSKSAKALNDYKDDDMVIKKETTNTFSGTFLRPEPPPQGASNSCSPLKKIVKNLQHHLKCENEKTPPKKQARKQSQQTRKTKLPANCNNFVTGENKKSKGMHFIKEEPPEQLLIDSLDNAATSPILINKHETYESKSDNKDIINKMNTSPTKFKMFMLSGTNDNAGDNANNKKNETVENMTTTTTMTSTPITAKQTKNKNSDNSTIDIDLDVKEYLFKCINCDGLVLKGTGERTTHELAGHHVLFKCHMCVRDFEQESGLKKHMKTHRAGETRKDAWKKCPDCGKCLKLGSMWMHRKIHTENKKYGCEICGLKFVQKINLTHHARVHTAEKPYECPECQKRFQERSHLYRHQKYHAQTRSYRCDKCGKMYKTERCLKVHNLVHLEQRPFACTVCDKSFISNSKLKQHSNIHTGERPFKCNYCPRDFTNFPNWLKHTRRRHKVDHKTGEQLENIPSYCSKKSSKTAQNKKTTTANSKTTTNTTIVANATIQTNSLDKNLNSNTLTSTTTSLKTTTSTVNTKATKNGLLEKAPIKRKKKTNNLEEINNNNNNNSNNNNNQIVDVSIQKTLNTKEVNNNTALNANIAVAANNNIIISNTKITKVKRERKQAAPKQVQKAIKSPLPPMVSIPTTANEQQFALPTALSVSISPAHIKREYVESNAQAQSHKNNMNNILNSFPDLHSLSITSAEELIMEQALEMEESVLFNARRASTMSVGMADTDNAVSATEASAASHFNVKHEVESEEELISLKDNKNRMLSSSLESSPFSSPASIELCNVVPSTNSTTAGKYTRPTNNMTNNSNIYFIPTPSLSANTAVTNNSNSVNNSSNSKLLHDNNFGLVQQSNSIIAVQQLQSQNNQIINFPAQSLINQLYLPSINGSNLLPLTSSQVLPSVDTLLFSAAAAAAAAAASLTSQSHIPTTTTTSSSRYYRGKEVMPQNQS